jgi:E3 ubiquitin-protein ligase HERC1
LNFVRKAIYEQIFQVWVWGSGPCLASGKVDAIFLLPRLVDELAQLRVVDIAAGDTHCLALTHDNEVCYIVYY